MEGEDKVKNTLQNDNLNPEIQAETEDHE